ncbi:eukaryotic translation initiation factor 4Ba isoform X1 [Colossoma macropomum]|uniref:eukaryotic translation initiation factor 4Ba isoform X1 n=1 Tax=Colossoma macropomum TaxID=42526 RepID=UPI0018643779|nr:eukaryotic translation initiation factor 4Ba isoform X1 [Colossoma macropomum]
MCLSTGKKIKKKGKTLTLTDFLAEDSGGSAHLSYPPAKPTSWADETDDLEGEVTTSWHTEDDAYRAPPIDRSILPTAPRAAREPNIDRSRLPRSPPYTAFLGNLPYDVTEDSIKDFFRGLSISAVRLPREPSNPERLKGFGYAEFDDVDSLLRALNLNEEHLGNRRIRVDIADQSNEKERDDRSMSGRDRNRGGDMGPDKTDTDWRARPSADADEGPRRDDSYGERSRDRYESDRYRDSSRRDDRYDSGRDRFRERYDDRDRRDYDRGFDSRSGGRRPFGSGFRRDYDDRRDDYRGSGDRYGDRYGDREDKYDKWEERREDRGPLQRPKLCLKPRSVPKEEDQSSSTSSASSRSASIFGGAKPVDTASKEREVEERLKKEQERLQRQLEEDKGRGPERKPRERHPSWRSEDQPTERSRTGSESSQPGNTTSRGSRRRESERSVENEVFSGREDEPPSPGSSVPPSKQEGLPLKVVPAPPPKENAWAKRSAMSTGSSESEAKPAVSPSSSAPPKSSTSSTDERVPQKGKDENKADGVRRDRGPSRGRGGASGPGTGRGRGDAASRDRRKETDRKDVRRERDLRPAPEPKKYEESPSPTFSSASKYAALLMDGDQGDDAEESGE